MLPNTHHMEYLAREFGPRLPGRRVLVVGAGQQVVPGIESTVFGNGRATSAVLARHGAVMACADQNIEAARETCNTIHSLGGTGRAIQADVRYIPEIDRMVSEAASFMGGLDGLVLNIGIGGGQVGLTSQTADVWDDVFAVNVRAHAFVCRAAMPILSDGASIVFVSSLAALRPTTGMPAYEASKAALEGLSRHVAMEGEARCIRSNIVLPGLMDTPNGRAASARRPDRASSRLPFNRQGNAWDVAYAILFLLSNESSYVNAQSLAVDGGYTALGLK